MSPIIYSDQTPQGFPALSSKDAYREAVAMIATGKTGVYIVYPNGEKIIP